MKRKIKVGILINDFFVPAWQYSLLKTINDSNYSKITLIIKKRSKQQKKEFFFNRLWRSRRQLFFYFFQKLDKKLFNNKPDAFEKRDIQNFLNSKVLIVEPKETKFSDIINSEDIKKIKSFDLDVLYRVGFRILRGEVLNSAKFGVWSYHHGDNRFNRGGPAGLWEFFLNWDTTGAILQKLNENLDGGTILSKSTCSTNKLSLTRNRNNLYWSALSLFPRTIKELYNLGEAAFWNKVYKLNENPIFYYNKLFKEPTNLAVIYYSFKKYFNYLLISFDNLLYFNQWVILFRLEKNIKFSKSFFRFKEIIPPKDRFWADPFVIEKDNKFFIFIEELVYSENKGKIAVIEMDKSGNYSLPKVILEKDYHLSYPFIFEKNNKYYMIPETAQNNNIELYKCIDFPYKWEFKKSLISDIYAVDSTIFKHKNKYWLFTNMKEQEVESTHNKLFLFFAEDPIDNQWTAHPLNPIVSDVKKARSAGNIFIENGKIYRPSQNSGKHYGFGITINEILELNESSYTEKEIQLIKPNWNKHLFSIHTINNAENLTVIDAQIRRRKF